MESVKRKVAFLTPQEEEFEARYRIDAKEISVDLGSFGGQQGVVLVDNTAVKVEPNGLSTRYVQRVIQVLQPGAVQQMQAWPISFDPDREEVRVIEASILKPDGRRVHAESMVTDALSDPQYRLYYRNRNLVLSFPSLATGDRIWIEYKMSAVGEQNDYGRYFGDWVPFAGMLPILLKQYTLVMPEDFPLFMQAKGLDVKPIVMTVQGRKVYRWVSRDIPHLQREPEMPGFSEVAPYLQLSTFEDWDALGRWYAKFIADQWELTPEMKAKVAEITSGCTTVEDRVRAIHRWVVQQTHYVGLEFGVHGFRPYKVKQIFERRFGDCKDKAILMAAMFKEAGVDACMVLTRTRDNGEILSSPATMSIFNHAICYVPELDLFLDGTAEYTGTAGAALPGPRGLGPTRLAGRAHETGPDSHRDGRREPLRRHLRGPGAGGGERRPDRRQGRHHGAGMLLGEAPLPGQGQAARDAREGPLGEFPRDPPDKRQAERPATPSPPP